MAVKKARMTNKERVMALLNRQKPDRIPIWPFSVGGFAVIHTETSISDAYNKPEVALASQRKTAEDFDWVFAPSISYAAFGGWEFGGDIKWPSGEFAQAPVVTRYPVQNEEDVWNLKIPDIPRAGIIPIMTALHKLAAEEEHDNKPFKVMAYVGGAFTRACNVAGMETFCRWLIKKPEAAHQLLRLTTDFSIQLAQYWRDRFGTDGVIAMAASEASTDNNMISPRHFEAFAFPYLVEIAEKVLAMGYKHIYTHICGEQNANLPYWRHVSLGDPGIISIGHEIEPEIAAEYFPKHIILGNLESAIIQVATPGEVYEATKRVIRKGRNLPSGYIFSPGCDLPPRSDPANVQAMVQAVDDHGWYE